MTRNRFVAALAAGMGLGFLALPLATAPALAQAKGPVVFAASSLQTALDDIKAQWQKSAGKEALISEGFESLRTFRPDLVLIGLGMPIQEEFLHSYFQQQHYQKKVLAKYALKVHSPFADNPMLF